MNERVRVAEAMVALTLDDDVTATAVRFVDLGPWVENNYDNEAHWVNPAHVVHVWDRVDWYGDDETGDGDEWRSTVVELRNGRELHLDGERITSGEVQLLLASGELAVA